MRIRFLGPIDRVTGSCYWLQHGGTEFLVDCGARVEDAHSAWNEGPFAFDPGKLAFVVVTHAHADHVGLLPRLVREGFRGRVYATNDTARLARLQLQDAARHEGACFTRKDVERIPFIEPGAAKAGEDTNPLFGHPRPVGPDLFVIFFRAGHIPGAVSVQFLWGPPDSPDQRSVTFSGDIGPNVEGEDPQPLIRSRMTCYDRGRQFAYRASYAVLESTYGNRARNAQEGGYEERLARWAEVLDGAVESSGTVVVPTFAIGRTQDVLFDLHVLFARHPERWSGMPVYLDAPLAVGMNNHVARALRRRSGRDGDERPTWLGRGAFRALDLDPDNADHHAILGEMLDEILLPQKDGDAPNLTGRDEGSWRRWSLRRRTGSALVGAWEARTRYVAKGSRVPLASGRPTVLLTSNATMDRGRVAQYLPQLLPRESTTLVLAGFTPPGSPASRIEAAAARDPEERARMEGVIEWPGVPGAPSVALRAIRARVVRIGGYSGHADQKSLVDWLYWTYQGRQARAAGTVFLTHGTAAARDGLRRAILGRDGELGEALRAGGIETQVRVELPDDRRWFDLDLGAWLEVGGDALDMAGLLERIDRLERELADLRRRLSEVEEGQAAPTRANAA